MNKLFRKIKYRFGNLMSKYDAKRFYYDDSRPSQSKRFYVGYHICLLIEVLIFFGTFGRYVSELGFAFMFGGAKNVKWLNRFRKNPRNKNAKHTT